MQINPITAIQSDNLLNISNIFSDPANSDFAKVFNTFLSVNQIDVSNSYRVSPTINIEAMPQQLSSITALNLNQIYEDANYINGNITIGDVTDLKNLFAFIKENINQISDITLNGKRISTDELNKLMNSEVLDNLYLNVVFPNIIINIATDEDLTKIDYFVNNQNDDELVSAFNNLLQKFNNISNIEKSPLLTNSEENSSLINENLLQNNATLKQNNNLNLVTNNDGLSSSIIQNDKSTNTTDFISNTLNSKETELNNQLQNISNIPSDNNDIITTQKVDKNINTSNTNLNNQLLTKGIIQNDNSGEIVSQKLNQNENLNNTLSTDFSNNDKQNTNVLSNNGDKNVGDVKLGDLQNLDIKDSLKNNVSDIEGQQENLSTNKQNGNLIASNKFASKDVKGMDENLIKIQQNEEKIDLESNTNVNKNISNTSNAKEILQDISNENNGYAIKNSNSKNEILDKENNLKEKDTNLSNQKQLKEISNKETSVKDDYIEINSAGQIKVSIKKAVNIDLVNNNQKVGINSNSQKIESNNIGNLVNDDIDVLHNELNQLLNHKTNVYTIDKEKDDKQNITINNKNDNTLLTQEKTTKNNNLSNSTNSQNNDLLFNKPANDKKLEFFENSIKNDINLDFNNYFNDIKETKSNFINNNSTSLVYKNVKVYEIIREVNNFVISRQAKQLVLQIEPERLGKMKVGIEVYNNVVKANVEVENETVKRMLENNNNLLRESLAQQGLQLAGFSISLSSNNDKSSSNTTFGSKKQQKKFSLKDGISKDDLAEESKEMTRKKMGYNSYEYIV